MATKVMEGSPLLTYEADETEGRKAFHAGQQPGDCPFPCGQGGNIRRLAWMRGYYSEKYWEPHQRRRWFDE
jgi:hypothetical protein